MALFGSSHHTANQRATDLLTHFYWLLLYYWTRLIYLNYSSL